MGFICKRILIVDYIRVIDIFSIVEKIFSFLNFFKFHYLFALIIRISYRIKEVIAVINS